MSRKIALIFVLLLLIGAAGISTLAQESQSWLVRYYNTRLPGVNQVYSTYVRSPNISWGSASPAPGVNADSWSARFSRTLTLTTGTYQLRARADDGLRVLINGVVYVDSWINSAGRQNDITFRLQGGDFLVEVEYWDNTGDAYIEFSLRAPQAPTQPTLDLGSGGGGGAPLPTIGFTPAPLSPTLDVTGPTVTIATGELNVRVAPNLRARILTSVRHFEVYPIIGRTGDDSWYQIVVSNNRIVGEVVGWVNADFVFVSGTAGIPQTYNISGTPQVTGVTGRATALLNLRAAPSMNSPALGLLVPPARVDILGRTEDSRWYYVFIEDYVGWVSADFIELNGDLAVVPVVGNIIVPTPGATP